MTAWLGTRYQYFSVDSADDLTTATLEVGDASLTYPVVAELVLSPPDEVAARLGAVQPDPPDGMTRYWWRVLIGAGTTLPMTAGVNSLYGRLTDAPEVEPYVWRFRL